MKIQSPRRSRITRILALAGSGAAVIGLTVTAGHAGAASAAPRATTLDCNSSFDPYAYTQAQVSACGYQTFAQTSVTAMVGGGSSYQYTVNGVTVAFLVPPANFHPATATAAQLDEYGFPAKPAASDTSDLTTWTKQMTGWKGAVTPPPFLAVSNTTANTVYTQNWSGYAVTGGQGTYTHAEAWYVEPSFGGSVCSTNAEVTWAGIGGYYGSSDDLGQNGTAHNVPGVGNHQAWWEIIPFYSIVPINFYGHAGYLFDASTRWLGNGYRFYFYDYYSGTTDALNVDDAAYSGDSAEAIAERPKVGNSFTNLSNFGTLEFQSTQANGVGLDQYSGSGPRHGVHMVDSGGKDMADPSDITGGGSFGVSQKSCN
jgi:hypothetical protein